MEGGENNRKREERARLGDRVGSDLQCMQQFYVRHRVYQVARANESWLNVTLVTR